VVDVRQQGRLGECAAEFAVDTLHRSLFRVSESLSLRKK
jgi:hypothetical protein